MFSTIKGGLKKPNLSIWKYPLELSDFVEHTMPIGAKILKVGNQDNIPTIWALVNTDIEYMETRTFAIIGTGHPMPDKQLSYIDSVICPPFVWHIFEVLS